MRWIILIGNSELNMNVLKNIDSPNCISKYDYDVDDRYCVDYGTDHIFYDLIKEDDVAYADFEEYKDLIPIDNPTIIMLTYTSQERVRQVLCQDNFPKDIYIDNDYDVIVPLKEFIEMGMPLDQWIYKK